MNTPHMLLSTRADRAQTLADQSTQLAAGRAPRAQTIACALMLFGVACVLGACESGTPTVRTYDTQGAHAGAQATNPASGSGPSAAATSPGTTTASPGISGGMSASAPAPVMASGAYPAANASATGAGSANDWDAAFDAASAAPTFKVEPDAGLSSFTGFMIDAPSVRLSATASPAALDPAEVRALAQTLATHLNDNLGESMTPTNVASAPGQTLRLRPTIARLAPRVDPSSPGGLSGVVFTQAACRVELLDAASDRVLATFVDASAPARALSGAARTDAELAQACLKLWAEQLAQRLDQARSR